MEFHDGPFVLALFDDPTYSPGSADNLRAYGREYSFAVGCQPNSKYGVSCQGPDQPTYSCILLAAAGATRVNSKSAVIVGERCFVAIGDVICSLTLPELSLLWTRRVDSATCFGVYYLPSHSCLVSHGELEIACLNLAGHVVWSAGGKDIFSEGFRLTAEYIEAIDFNHEVYHFDIATGHHLP